MYDLATVAERSTPATSRQPRLLRQLGFVKSRMRLLRLGLSVVLIALASGVPHLVLAAFDQDECAPQCDGDVDGKRCPPNCTQGACASSAFSAASPVGVVEAPLPRATALAPSGVAAPVLPLVTRGVFHPPRG